MISQSQSPWQPVSGCEFNLSSNMPIQLIETGHSEVWALVTVTQSSVFCGDWTMRLVATIMEAG